jgi:hypothetical protein
MSTSSPGSSRCHSCPSNTIFKESTESCVACNANEFSYPGDRTCRKRKPCIAEYDAVAIYSNCVDNNRTVEYKLRESSICRITDFTIPSKKTGVECKTCQAGTYIENGKCINCAEGKYSRKYNSNTCTECSQGYYAPKSIHFEEMEEFPEEITTTCRQAEDAYANSCDVHKGWVVYGGSFRVPPYLFKGIILTMKLPIEIKGSMGRVEFVYRLGRLENLSFIIDGNVNEMGERTDERTVAFNLTEGKHVLEWAFMKKEEINESKVIIKSIHVIGTTVGSARQCLKCEKGFIRKGNTTECVQCPLGMTANSDSTLL